MAPTQAEKARRFAALHQQDEIFVMPNAWDAGSAATLAAEGFAALGTTSGGVNWSHGREDYVYAVPASEMLADYGEIAAAVDLPVSGDLENGYGASPETVSETIRQSVAFGMVGGSIEDSTADPQQPLYDLDLAVERIRAARRAADETDWPYTLTARCEVYFADLDKVHGANPYAEAVRRANLYREAGADCIFIPGPSDADTIAGFVRDIDAPISVVTGLGESQMSVAQLADLGVRRISTGGSLARACLGHLRRSARAIAEQGTFDYLSAAISDPDINAFLRSKQP